MLVQSHLRVKWIIAIQREGTSSISGGMREREMINYVKSPISLLIWNACLNSA